ncbi:hypothetical protein EHQ97_14860 [Leptospira adleri]|nr:hypothetical protein EHQ97_14860 [Leptospira adleri]
MCPIHSCAVENSEKLSFSNNEQNGMVRFQAFLHGNLEPDRREKNYNFTVKQAENIRGIFQIDSTNPDLRIRLIQKSFPFDTGTDCTNTNSGNTYSCKIEINHLGKADYRLRVFGDFKTNRSSFNLFAGIFGNGYVHIE